MIGIEWFIVSIIVILAFFAWLNHSVAKESDQHAANLMRELATLKSNIPSFVNDPKYRDLPKVDNALFQQWIIELHKSPNWEFLLDTYLHNWIVKCGSFAESGSVNSELLNSGKIQAVRGLAEYVESYVQRIKLGQMVEQQESLIDE